MDWSPYYPAYTATDSETSTARQLGEEQELRPSPLTKDVEVADIGCGFGGLLIALGPKLPHTLLLGT